MGILRSIFGPSQNEIWSKIAADVGGNYQAGNFWSGGVLRYRSGQWEITLDTYTVSTGKSSITYTRMRAPFVNKDGLRFKIYRAGLFASIGKMLGMQDIEVLDPSFSERFIIQGNIVEKIKWLLDDPELKTLIDRQPQVHLEIKDDEGWFKDTFPEGVDELCFLCVGVLRDEALLKGLFDMFSLTLRRLVQIDSAYDSDPNMKL